MRKMRNPCATCSSLLLAVAAVWLLAGVAAADPTTDYLADIQDQLLVAQQGWGELGINACANVAGAKPIPIQIGQTVYGRGIGTHAPGRLVVELSGAYERFEAAAGVQALGHPEGSVVFQVWVDGKKRFDSGVRTERDPAVPVSVDLTGAQELALVVTDAGDGISSDCANWAEARLVRSGPPPAPSRSLDLAPFARVMAWDPARAEGTAAGRVEEFPAADLYLGRQLSARKGGYQAVAADGRTCLGLQWAERRRPRLLALDVQGTVDPAQAGLEYWSGATQWQGRWQPLPGTVRQEGDLWQWEPDWRGKPEGRTGTLQVRWIFPAGKDVTVRAFHAYTATPWATATVHLQLEKPQAAQGWVEVYNGELVEGAGRISWSLAQPLTLHVRYHRPGAWRADRTVLRLQLPKGSCGVGLDDLAANGTMIIRPLGVVAKMGSGAGTGATRAQAGSGEPVAAHVPPVLEAVRQLPEQTFAQALAKTHHAIQDNGPTMLSLACDNAKLIVEREGRVTLGSLAVQPRYGDGTHTATSRRLDGGWLPMPLAELTSGGVRYSQRTFVAPFDLGGRDQGLGVVEITAENPSAAPAAARIALDMLADAEKGRHAVLQAAGPVVLAMDGDRVAAALETASLSPLEVQAAEGQITVSGSLPAGAKASCRLYLPSWPVPRDCPWLLVGEKAARDTVAYWHGLLGGVMQVELPDELLANVMRASQVHCLIAARNEADGARVAPWIAANTYGPLESESNSIIRGMDLWGHHDFARRSLDFFISRYHPAGYLTTGYTLMGTGWHLWTLGEHFALTRDTPWLQANAAAITRACQWVKAQREKTRRRVDGNRPPEAGLMPPGVMADWGNYAYYFCLNGHYYAGLREASWALGEIAYPGAKALQEDAVQFRRDIQRAYAWTQGESPVVPLRDGTWVEAYPSQAGLAGPTGDFFPGEDGNRSWCYDVELGAHHLVVQGVLDAKSDAVSRMMEHMEDVQFLADGWFDYPAAESEQDWFDLGGFSKVQPYYCRNAEIYALRDDVKPFLRSYFNALAAMLNTENLSLWEHFHNGGAWNKTHETGYLLAQSRLMLVMERGGELWLAPFTPASWLADGQVIAVTKAPTRFGPVSYRIESHLAQGYVEATVEPPGRQPAQSIVLRLRHPEGKPMRRVTVNGQAWRKLNPKAETIALPVQGVAKVRVEY